MPPAAAVVGAVAGAVKTAAAFAAVTIASTPVLSSIAGFVTSGFGASLAINAVSRAIAPKPKVPQFATAESLKNLSIMSRTPIETRKVVYGVARVSGPIIFLETSNNNRDLHIVVALAGHQIHAVDDLFFEDKIIKSNLADNVEVASNTTTNPNYAATTRITAHFGGANQAADANLVSRTSWTSSHRLRGVAYLYARLQYEEDVFANGIPNISATVKGKRVFDPRTNTTAYSNNAALCIRDFLTDGLYGLGALSTEIDDASFIAAANICDENVSKLGGGTEKRYTINGVVDSSSTPREILEGMLSACGGTVYWTNGKWHIKVGAYITPTVTLTNDDLAGPINVKTRNSTQEQFNAVKGLFLSPENNWQPTNYPEVTSAIFQAEDNNERKYAEYSLIYTTSSSAAQRLSKQFLYRNREQLQLELICKLTAFQFEVGDTIKINNERFGFIEKPFEVLSWAFVPSQEQGTTTLAIAMIVKETSPAVYAWDSAIDEKAFTFNNTTLPSAFDVPPPGLAITDQLQIFNEEVISVLIADVTSSTPFVNRFEVQARRLGDAEWINLGQASGKRFELINVEDRVFYEVRARLINTFGVRSQFALGLHQIVGKTAPPSNVQRFAGNVVGGSLVLTWDAIPDLDLSHYKIRYSPLLSGAEYQNSVLLVPRIPRPGTSTVVPARPGTYFIKAVDKLNLVSPDAGITIVSTNIPGIEQLNVVDTLIEHPDFAGLTDGTVVTSENLLVLDTAINFDDVLGNFDDALGLFDGGGGGQVATSGLYYFANSLDLGDKYTSRVTVSLSVSYLNYVDTFDSLAGLFDDRLGLFDGDPNALERVNVEIQVRTTNDDPAGTPVWTDWRTFVVGDYTARAFEFRALLTSQDATASPAVSFLEVEIDMPDRVLGDNDLQSGAGQKIITFMPSFRVTPAIGIAVGNLQTGDYYEITNKSATGFTIEFKNAAGTSVDRQFDWIAKGYGRLET